MVKLNVFLCEILNITMNQWNNLELDFSVVIELSSLLSKLQLFELNLL